MALADAAIREAAPADRPFKLFDELGLLILIVPAGGKWWRFGYRFGGRQKSLSMGVYSEVDLDEARARRDEARQLLAQGSDPAEVRREENARRSAERLAEKSSATVRVSVALDGDVEIWKGRAVLRLASDEATAVKDILTRLAA
ncbi:MAG: integrase arm-type DNA-binding domain-containing protein [Betaproteobacteria bacterium]|nr:integrase arm-type DNA-binding domain-containing protein [Betaproteobacteria bacterium]